MNITILRYDTLDSTNTEAAKQARLGADEGLCVMARQQTAGRGRQGRKWVSDPGSGLYFSIVLRPKLASTHLPLMTLMAGVAVNDTIREIGLKPDIKWVNDLHVDGKKICGILAETTDTPKGFAVIVGIGINLTGGNASMNEPGDRAAGSESASSGNDATSLKEHGASVMPSEIAESLTRYITYFYAILQSENGPANIIDEWRKRSSYFTGKPVRVVLENEALTGITDGLEATGALRVKRNDGTVTIVQAGDVEQLRAA